MRWPEIDLDKRIWMVPADRMKAGREHRVRLSARAVVVLRQLEKLKTSDFIFAGQARNKPLSNIAMEMVLRRMKVEGATVHGFRSSFRDWAGNVSNFPREITETALAHVIGDKGLAFTPNHRILSCGDSVAILEKQKATPKGGFSH
jgi:integrase